MIIGIPKEIKIFEFRVGLTPEGVRVLAEKGHRVLVERGAGSGSGYPDSEYRAAGAVIVASAKEVYRRAGLIIKVKEPQPKEYALLRPGQILFAFLHLAAHPDLDRWLKRRKVRAIPFEDMEEGRGFFPILAPMSEIAGLLAALMGANYLRRDLGGKGILLSGAALQPPGKVVILGAGHVGSHALRVTHGLGACVTMYDMNRERLEALQKSYSERVSICSEPGRLKNLVAQADLLIGAVLLPGKQAPCLVTKEMVKNMGPGSVIVDVAIDQGGCIETIRPTTLKDPVYTKFGVVHCGVPNLPSLAARTATQALAQATLPYLVRLASGEFQS